MINFHPLVSTMTLNYFRDRSRASVGGAESQKRNAFDVVVRKLPFEDERAVYQPGIHALNFLEIFDECSGIVYIEYAAYAKARQI